MRVCVLGAGSSVCAGAPLMRDFKAAAWKTLKIVGKTTGMHSTASLLSIIDNATSK